jgi:hypothetical protein
MYAVHSRDRSRLLPHGIRDALASAASTILSPLSKLRAQRRQFPRHRRGHDRTSDIHANGCG